MLSITFLFVLLSTVSRVLFFAVVGVLCCYELSRQLEKLNVYCSAWVMYVYVASQAVLALTKAQPMAYLASFLCAVYLAMFSGILRKKVSGNGALDTVAGLGYPAFLFAILLMISVSDIWWQTLLMAAASTWVCDSFALFGGVRFGKHKLAPTVSPNKTWEGTVSGALSSIVTGVLCWLIYRFTSPIPLWLCVVTALLASSMGQIGDLAESLLKRMIGVKDFSNLIPGHGGVFDRADSLLFSIPTAYLCFILAGV